MILGRVKGCVVSTVKHPSYDGKKVMLVEPVMPDGTPKKGTMVAVDTVGAGEGDIVIVASEGRSAVEILGFSARMPLRSVIIGIVDHIEHTAHE
jgi:ethanolamine utilization protein EutN